jgi:hypothetical protein
MKPEKVLRRVLFVSLALVDRFTTKMLKIEHPEIESIFATSFSG